MSRIAFNGFYKIRNQIVPPFKCNVNITPGIFYQISEFYKAIENNNREKTNK